MASPKQTPRWLKILTLSPAFISIITELIMEIRKRDEDPVKPSFTVSSTSLDETLASSRRILDDLER